MHYDKTKNSAIWRINAFSKQAVDEMLQVMYQVPNKIFLKQRGCHLLVKSRRIVEATNYKSMATAFLQEGEVYHKASFQFLTGTSFKVDGQYVMFPDPARMYKGIMKRWNAFSTTEVFEYDELIEALCNHVYVMDYRLQMQKFSVDRKGMIPGFRGQYVLGFRNNSVLSKLAALMSYFATFCGVGIKAGLGMGAVTMQLEKK